MEAGLAIAAAQQCRRKSTLNKFPAPEQIIEQGGQREGVVSASAISKEAKRGPTGYEGAARAVAKGEGAGSRVSVPKGEE